MPETLTLSAPGGPRLTELRAKRSQAPRRPLSAVGHGPQRRARVRTEATTPPPPRRGNQAGCAQDRGGATSSGGSGPSRKPRVGRGQDHGWGGAKTHVAPSASPTQPPRCGLLGWVGARESPGELLPKPLRTGQGACPQPLRGGQAARAPRPDLLATRAPRWAFQPGRAACWRSARRHCHQKAKRSLPQGHRAGPLGRQAQAFFLFCQLAEIRVSPWREA